MPRSEPASGFAGGKVVKVDRVEWIIIRDPSTAFAALQNNEVDMLDAPPLDLLPTVEHDSNIVIGEVWPLESYAVLRFNELWPPFNNLQARQAVGHAMNQNDYMSAAYGDPKYWHECYAFWVCGSPNGTEIGSEAYRKPDLDLARKLVRESGYDGTPVVLIGGSDIPAYQRMSLVTVDLLQKIGFKVDLQLSDWGSVATRRQNKDAPAKGGWNLFHTSANGAQLASPLTSPSTITTCDGKNFYGWPCDQVEEDMRLRYIREPDPAKRMALLEDMHRRLWEVLPYLPLGQFVQPFLWRTDVIGGAEVERAGVLEYQQGVGALAPWQSVSMSVQAEPAKVPGRPGPAGTYAYRVTRITLILTIKAIMINRQASVRALHHDTSVFAGWDHSRPAIRFHRPGVKMPITIGTARSVQRN